MQQDFYKRTGKMALGSRLRQLSEQLTSEAAEVYKLYDNELHPKWFPVFYSLADEREKSVTTIAREIGHTHPSVSNILREMQTAGLVRLKQGKDDARQSLAVLTAKGRRLVVSMNQQYTDVDEAIEAIFAESRYDLWAALQEWENLLAQKSFLQRVKEYKARRESDDVQIVPFDDSLHHDAFRTLNEEWILDLFGFIEETDHYEFDHPVENILRRGGYIFMALLKGEPVGTFALMRSKNPKYDYELIKFAVSPKAQGHGIGSRLLEACLTYARRTGGYRLFLESNRKCAAAVHLYEKFGFQHLSVIQSDYARCDVQMELTL